VLDKFHPHLPFHRQPNAITTITQHPQHQKPKHPQELGVAVAVERTTVAVEQTAVAVDRRR
jgi:hypothetical protein